MSSIDGRSMIGASRAEGDGTPFRAVNPATRHLLEPLFVSATAAEVDGAAALAEAASASLRNSSGKTRGELLRGIAANLESGADAVIARAHAETALPILRLQSELARTCGQLRLFAAVVEEGSWVAARIDRSDRERKPLPKPDVRSMLRPLGPVAVFGASNFPLAFSVVGGDTASALAAGCPVVVKAHPAHPGTSELAGAAIVHAVREVGLPSGVFSLLFDAGYAVAMRLVQHPAIRAVGFTGSRRGGVALMHAAAERPDPIPVYAEMGSVNPVFVLGSAQRRRAGEIAAGLQASVTAGVGQFCTNPGLVVVERSGETAPLIAAIAEKLGATTPGTMLTAGIADAYREGVARLSATRNIVRHTPPLSEDAPGPALFGATAAAFLEDPSLAEEVFGPSTLVIECDGARQLLEVARSLEGQLTATVHADPDDLEDHRELLELLATKAGRVVVNGYPTGVEVCHAMVHGGPWPATSDGRSTSVGTRAIERFTRPVCYQDWPDSLLPPELQASNPLRVRRMLDGLAVRR